MRATRVILLAAVAACGGEGKRPAEVDAGADPTTQDGSISEDLTDPAPEGTWMAATCDDSAQWKRELTVAGTNAEVRYAKYPVTDPDCTEPYAVLTMSETYSVRGAATAAANAHKIDLAAHSTTMVVDGVAATYYNTIVYCGLKTWKAGVAQDLAGRTCEEDDGSFVTYAKVGAVHHDIYAIDADQLSFGDASSGAGTSDGTRPTKLDTVHLTKQ